MPLLGERSGPKCLGGSKQGIAEVCLTAAPLRYLKYDILMMGQKLGHSLDSLHIMIYFGPVENFFWKYVKCKCYIQLAVQLCAFAILFSMVE